MNTTAVEKTTPFSYAELSTTPVKAIVAGCVLSIGGNLLISISLNIQKYTHIQNAKSEVSVHYTKKPLWWVGLLLMAVGEIGNFSAYGFAPASLVAPLGTFTVISNMFIAVTFLKEQLRPEDVFGCNLAIIGACLLVVFSSKTEEILTARNITRLLGETAFIVYAVLEGVALIGLLVLKYYVRVQSVVITLLIGALIASFTVIASKAVSGMLQLSIGGYIQVNSFIFWFMLVVMVTTCIMQVKFLNQAMSSYDSSVVVPTNFVLFTTSTIGAGIIFFKEFYGLSPINIFMFLFGCLMCFLGVFFITSGRSLKNKRDATGDKEGEFSRLATELFPPWIFESISRVDKEPLLDDVDMDNLSTQSIRLSRTYSCPSDNVHIRPDPLDSSLPVMPAAPHNQSMARSRSYGSVAHYVDDS